MTASPLTIRPDYGGTLSLSRRPEPAPALLLQPRKSFAERLAEMRQALGDRYPAALVATEDDRVTPLAIGALDQLSALAPQLSSAQCQKFLSAYTRRMKYLLALASDGARRVNLDGSDAGPVSDAHKQAAREALRRLEVGRTCSREHGSAPTGSVPRHRRHAESAGRLN